MPPLGVDASGAHRRSGWTAAPAVGAVVHTVAAAMLANTLPRQCSSRDVL